MSNDEDISPKLTLDLIKRLEDKLAFIDRCSKDYYSSTELFSILFSTTYIFILVHNVEEESNTLINCVIDFKDMPSSFTSELLKLGTEISIFAANTKPYVSGSDSYIRQMIHLYETGIPFDVYQYTNHIQRILSIKEEEPDREALALRAKDLVDIFNKLHSQYISQDTSKTNDSIEPPTEIKSPDSFLGLAPILAVIGFFILLFTMVVKT